MSVRSANHCNVATLGLWSRADVSPYNAHAKAIGRRTRVVDAIPILVFKR